MLGLALRSPHRRATSSGSVSRNSPSPPCHAMTAAFDESESSSSRNCHSWIWPPPAEAANRGRRRAYGGGSGGGGADVATPPPSDDVGVKSAVEFEAIGPQPEEETATAAAAAAASASMVLSVSDQTAENNDCADGIDSNVQLRRKRDGNPGQREIQSMVLPSHPPGDPTIKRTLDRSYSCNTQSPHRCFFPLNMNLMISNRPHLSLSECSFFPSTPGACSLPLTPSLRHDKPTHPEEKKKAFTDHLTKTLSIFYALFNVTLGLAVYVTDIVDGSHPTAEQQWAELANAENQTEANQVPQGLDLNGFCFGHLIHSGLLLGYQIVFLTSSDHKFYECASVPILALDLIYPMYSFLLLFFIFKYSNVIVNKNVVLARFGVMHCLSSSICFWAWTIFRETLEAIANKESKSDLKDDKHSENKHNLTSEKPYALPMSPYDQGAQMLTQYVNTSLRRFTEICDYNDQSMRTIYKDFSPYLYPFSVEFSILVVGVLYMMWQNIAMCKKMDDQDQNEKHSTRQCRTPLPIGHGETESNVVVYMDCHSSHRGLFGGFFVLILTIVSSILFFIAIYMDEKHKNRYDLGIMLNIVTSAIILILMTVACIFGYRQITKLDVNSAYDHLLDDVLLFICIPAYFLNGIFSIIPAIIHSNIIGSFTIILEVFQVLIQTLFILDGVRRSSNTKQLRKKKPGRELVTFLIISNISLWLMQTFEVKSHEMQDNRHEFYGKELWIILGFILRFALVIFGSMRTNLLDTNSYHSGDIISCCFIKANNCIKYHINTSIYIFLSLVTSLQQLGLFFHEVEFSPHSQIDPLAETVHTYTFRSVKCELKNTDKMRSRSNSGVRLDYYQRLLHNVIMEHQNPVTGLFPVSLENNHAWIRDNVYCVLSVWGLSMAYKKMADQDEDRAKTYELEQSCVKLMRGLLMCMMQQKEKVERFKQTQNPLDSLHAKYSSITGQIVVGDNEWGHLQIDAISLYLLILAQMTASGLQIVFNLDEVAFIQNLVFYIECAYCTPDYGIWERGDKTNHGLPELNASSIGMAKAALEAMNELDLFGARGGPYSVIHVLADEAQKCQAVLQGNKDVADDYTRQLEEIMIKTNDGLRLVPELYSVPAELVGEEYKEPGSQQRISQGHCPFLWAQSLYIIGKLLQEGFLAPGELDPLNRRLCAEKKPDVVVQVVILAEDNEIRDKLAEHDIVVQTIAEVAPIEVQPAKVLSHLYTYLGRNKKLGMSGRKSRDVGILSTSKLYSLGDKIFAFTPQFTDMSQNYVASDYELMIDICKSEINFLKSSWQNMLGRPLVTIVCRRVHLEDGKLPLAMMTTMKKLKSGYINGTRVTLGNLTDFLSTSCIANLSFLGSHEEGMPDKLNHQVQQYLEEHSVRTLSQKCMLLNAGRTSVKGRHLLKRRMSVKGAVKKTRSINVDSETLGMESNASLERRGSMFFTLNQLDVVDHAKDVRSPSPEEPREFRKREAAAMSISRHRHQSEAQYADTEVEELFAMLRETESLEEQGDILQYLVDTKGLDFNTGMLEYGKVVTVKDLLKGMLGKRVEDLAKSVTDLLVRQKQITVGMPPNNEHTITAPLPESDLRLLIREAYGEDDSAAMLTQELLLYLAMFIRTEPQLFLEMLRLRVMATELSRTLICDGDEASEHLLNLSPFEMKNLLHHILSGKEFAISSVGRGNFSIVTNKSSRISKKSHISLGDTTEEVEPDRQGQWLRRRRLDGALNRVPRDFYPRVWGILEKCQGLDIAGKVLPQTLTQEMTPGELKFALAVETVLNTIPQPEYRQLIVETLMVLTLVVEYNVVATLGGIIQVEYLVHKANELFLDDQMKCEGDATLCCAKPKEMRETSRLGGLLCGGAAGICQHFYDSAPSGCFGTMTYLTRAIAITLECLPKHGELDCTIS
ncbi:unnamed protein product [Callosobruchus maculatus]|uniref:Phosphorylase b kinase regulatory subunit n=1 Tax=Callosobruchus maculatus TaxID=64391 RepID=A0A653DTJ9_CALMS|nr:unnamed protein product [Callosobruchus maculatus]